MSSVPGLDIGGRQRRPAPKRPNYALRAGALGFMLGSVVAVVAAVALSLASPGGRSTADPSRSAGAQQAPATPQSAPQAPSGSSGSVDADTDLSSFSDSVMADIQSSWEKVFTAEGRRYQPAQLALYSGGVNTACGAASSAVGPFYCPADQQVYIDPSFYSEMRNQLGASGDFAWAYVIAHEVGHHIQALVGTADKVAAAQQQNASAANDLSVRMELQADCFAGVWGHSASEAGLLEDGDLEEGLNAAASVGDDRLQSSTGSIDPDSFTHGTSAQRVGWFKKGFDSGDESSCDTFASATR